MKKLLLLIFPILFITTANAANDPLETCLKKIYSDSSHTWQKGLNDIFKTNDLDDFFIEQNKSQIYYLISQMFEKFCGSELVSIAKSNKSRGQINFTHKNKNYGFDFDVNRIFDDVGIQTGILVINKRNLFSGSVLKLSDIPKNAKFFNDECSDHTIWDNLDDDAAVNVAGQAVFSEHGGSEHEYFLDFAEGDNRRAFPGLVLQDVTNSSEERIVYYMNIKTAIERTQQFAAKLKNGKCSNQGLAVYLVALNVAKSSDNRDTSATVTSGIGGGIAGGATAASLIGVGASFSWVPIAGWVVGGVLVTAGGVIALWPQKITDIEQVMILDGPYNL